MSSMLENARKLLNCDRDECCTYEVVKTTRVRNVKLGVLRALIICIFIFVCVKTVFRNEYMLFMPPSGTVVLESRAPTLLWNTSQNLAYAADYPGAKVGYQTCCPTEQCVEKFKGTTFPPKFLPSCKLGPLEPCNIMATNCQMDTRSLLQLDYCIQSGNQTRKAQFGKDIINVTNFPCKFYDSDQIQHVFLNSLFIATRVRSTHEVGIYQSP